MDPRPAKIDFDAVHVLADGTPMYADRSGAPISARRFAELYEDVDYRIVARTDAGPYTVTTAWLGIDQGGGPDAPLWFGTIVSRDGVFDDDYERFAGTESAAREDHAHAVRAHGRVRGRSAGELTVPAQSGVDVRRPPVYRGPGGGDVVPGCVQSSAEVGSSKNGPWSGCSDTAMPVGVTHP